MSRPAAGFELLEHTADVGIRAWAASAPETFGQAAAALAEMLGARVPGPGLRRRIHLRAQDQPALLVAFLDELIGIHEVEGVGFVGTDVIGLSGRSLVAEVETAPLLPEAAGVGVKAATYHQLAVERRPDGLVEARVYLDV